MSEEKEKALQTKYFSKEFPPDWEVEWKANLATLDPTGFIFQAYERVAEGKLFPYVHPKSLGEQSLGIRYFDVNFHYYGHEDEFGWQEDFVLAQPPGFPILIPRIKTDVQSLHLNNDEYNIIIRKEVKVGLESAFQEDELVDFRTQFEVTNGCKTRFLGTLRRERYSFYLSNSESRRNWSLVSDRCTPINPKVNAQLAQVEMEYKGIDGHAIENPLNQRAALEEMDGLGKIVIRSFGSQIIQPTSITKFEWLLGLN